MSKIQTSPGMFNILSWDAPNAYINDSILKIKLRQKNAETYEIIIYFQTFYSISII